MNQSAFSLSGGGGIAIFILIAVAVIAFAIYGWQQAKKRREALAAWAGANGLSFSAARETGFEFSFPDFRQLRSGEGGRYAYNIIRGNYRKRDLLAFDYHYETYSTDDKGNRTTQEYHFSALIAGCEVPLKPLFIRPEGLFDHIAAAFGFEDIQFESAEFSRRYMVKAPDRKWAYDVLHARAIEFLLAQPKFSMQFGDRNQVMFWDGGTWKPEQFELSANTVGAFLDMLPDYVKEDLARGVV